jgi:hypothetical protein
MDNSSVPDFVQAMLGEPVFRSILLDPSITHMAMAEAGSGDDTCVAIASGQCNPTASLKLPSS